MPRTISAGLSAHLQGSALNLATLVRVDRTDGVAFGYSSVNVPLTFNGLVYNPVNSIQPSAVKAGTTTGIDTLEIMGAIGAELDDSDVEQGLYDDAVITVQLVNYMDLTMGPVTLGIFRFGEFTFKDATFSAELMSLTSLLKQQTGDVTQPGCRVRRLGDAQCKLNLAAYHQTGVITGLGGTATASVDNPIDRGNIGGPDFQDWSSLAANSGGSIGPPTTATISTTGVTAPAVAAPATIYQSYCFGSGMVYNMSALTPGEVYTVQLHFAEVYFGAGGTHGSGGAGSRVFDVFINGTKVLDHLDVYSVAGGNNKAYVWRGTATADASGYISITFASHSDNPMLSGIEVLSTQTYTIAGGIVVGANTQPTRFYDYGVLYALTGASAGKQFDIKNHALVSGAAVLTLRSGLNVNLAIGDEVRLEAGCDRTIQTCIAKFSNHLNFHGEPYLPGNTKLIQIGRAPS